MTIRWSRLHSLLLILVIVLAVGIFVAGYMGFIQPLEEQVIDIQDEIDLQEQLIANAENNNESLDSSTNLQLQLPIDKQTDQMLVRLKEIQEVSNSSINQYTIEHRSTGNEATDAESANDQTSAIPNNVGSIYYQLQVTSGNYQQMYQFLNELREMDRIVSIDSLQFGPNTNENFDFSVSFTAYYSPTLNGLRIEAPTFEYEPSAAKETPFPE
ncbi:hypothetical protein NC661_02040 [Aquibacillus koreensis]|uniref:Pilus assembly protein PilO n=1 Tax=Aquibacillus koreensis TaxID=279446 RepID=A0A9X3WKQ9_9BACI|nr:hypothetical protein [Aquibacillus koreensis]MCT2537950.1 hypothetical protein [Aquibacillus koreensis]MDC3419159.1 hypothetical protein [Aquibacillus koreensis]